MKYNRSQIMKNAWRTYKYVGKKQGKTFAECLKSTWRLAKLQVSIEDNRMKAKIEREARNQELSKVTQRKPVSADYKGHISHMALYGHEFVSGGYCGD